MFAEEIISQNVPTLGVDDTAQHALDRLTEFKVKHLPVLTDRNLLGLIAEDDLLSLSNHHILLSDKSINLLQVFTLNDTHTYDVIRLMSQLNLSVLPVLDQNKNYLGAIPIGNMVNAIAGLYAVNEPGGIIVLEIGNRDNSLAHIAQIVEADNAQILSSSVNAFKDSTRLEVTLKVNKTEITALVASFERYNYIIKEVHNNTQVDNGSQDRYDSLMKYLNV